MSKVTKLFSYCVRVCVCVYIYLYNYTDCNYIYLVTPFTLRHFNFPVHFLNKYIMIKLLLKEKFYKNEITWKDQNKIKMSTVQKSMKQKWVNK